MEDELSNSSESELDEEDPLFLEDITENLNKDITWAFLEF